MSESYQKKGARKDKKWAGEEAMEQVLTFLATLFAVCCLSLISAVIAKYTGCPWWTVFLGLIGAFFSFGARLQKWFRSWRNPPERPDRSPE